jgi:hypothetical protein
LRLEKEVGPEPEAIEDQMELEYCIASELKLALASANLLLGRNLDFEKLLVKMVDP